VTLCHIPEGLNLRQQNCDNLRSCSIDFNQSVLHIYVCVCVYIHVFELGDDGRVLQEKQLKGKSNQFLCAYFMYCLCMLCLGIGAASMGREARKREGCTR
jgi:hypothetical protein